MKEYNSQFRRIIKKLNDIDDKLEKPYEENLRILRNQKIFSTANSIKYE